MACGASDAAVRRAPQCQSGYAVSRTVVARRAKRLIVGLGTRVVVPLYTALAMRGKTMKTLTPVLVVGGKSYVMVTPQLAGVARKYLGAQVGELSAQRDAILAALDFLVAGF